MAASDFKAVPVLDYQLTSSPTDRATFIADLRSALINVGFLYLSHPPVDLDPLISYIPKLFALPQDVKDGLTMANSPHFLGYSKFGAELTTGKTDLREQWDFATQHETRWREGDGEHYHRLWGTSQWPEEHLIPGFKAAYQKYLNEVTSLGDEFVRLVSEALGLSSTGLDSFYDKPEYMQHRSKIVKYPTVPPDASSDQGVGPHYDAGFLTFLLQASDHRGLQVQNRSGEWIDVPPVPNTFVINIGKALEFVTQGAAIATSHRVLSPRGDTPRYSVPFFQNISLDVRLNEKVLQLPPEIITLRDARGNVTSESVNFGEFGHQPSGMVNLIGRVKSHPDVAEKHYPVLFKQYFPDGLPAQGAAY